MRYRVLLYNHQLPIDMQPKPIEIDCDEMLDPGERSIEEDAPFVTFVRGGVPVGVFRRDQIQAIYEVPA